MKKVLLLGSGALKIGEAGEFDYSGSQALKALKEENITVVLINPNIATIQTSQNLADKIYFLPVNPYFVEKVIKKEKPDGIFLSFGGQTALNCGLALEKKGVFKKYGVKVLGSPVKSIELTEDRKLFAERLTELNVKTPRAGFARTVKDAITLSKKIGFPLMIRSGFALGGLGSSVVYKKEDLVKIVSVALRNAPQIAIEEYLKHWKEIEYEVVRDKLGNKITVCNMENLDPLGVHTGESIVVAPSQTLNNFQYHFLREISLRVIESLGIVGECNIQFALDPKSNDYRVIEVNARLSRSSALASKATGYPLAYVAAKLGLGKTLPELRNRITLSTSAFFEPALDYIVIKMPRWDLQKFDGANTRIGSEMKSVGEVMAIGRSFPEALQKAIRMLGIEKDGFLNGADGKIKKRKLEEYLSPATNRLFLLAKELEHSVTLEDLYRATGIDPWFISQIKIIVDFEKLLKNKKVKLEKTSLLEAKQLGFSDKIIAGHSSLTEEKVRASRIKLGITPKVKHIDTLAAEYPAKTNYLYLTYHGEESETDKKDHKGESIIVVGSGPYRIGSSVEFDWCGVTATEQFRKRNIQTIVINCNPETVSTDFDTADKLYFEELSLERILDIYQIEQNSKLVLAFGGQIPNNLALKAHLVGLNILGTSPLSIDIAEDRHKFSGLLDKLEIDQPFWKEVVTLKDAKVFSKKIGYPVLIRPSYVLSGSAMNVAFSGTELKDYIEKATEVSSDHPVVISKFIDNAKEIEIDGVAQKGKLVIHAISEHLENAGVHSGDATIVLPPQRLFLETIRQIKVATEKITQALSINGPFNIQFLAKDNLVKVIELNLRASRSFPFVSKVTGFNFVEIACKVILGEQVLEKFDTLNLDYVGVKAPQFSFQRIKGFDPTLRVEMASTGEVACFGEDLYEAYLKSLLSTGFRIPKNSVFISVGGEEEKISFLDSVKKLKDLGLKIYATENTSLTLKEAGIKNTRVYKISENKSPSAIDLIEKGLVDLVINIGSNASKKISADGFAMRRACVDFNVPLITNLQSAIVLASALDSKKLDDLQIKSWDEYLD